MKRLTTILAGGIAALGTVAVLTAQEAPPQEYVDAMQSIRGAVAAAGAEEPDFAAISEAAEGAAAGFQYVQAFWAERGDDEAAALAGDGSRAAQSIVVAADMTSAEGVAFSLDQMRQTCGACHMAHRVEMEGGGFGIQ